MQVRSSEQRGRMRVALRMSVAALGVSFSLWIGPWTGEAQAQSLDCYDRALVLPSRITPPMAESCHSKVKQENTTNDRHAIALYNGARLFIALADAQTDSALRTQGYDSAVADILESRERAGEDNIAFTQPWRRGDKHSQAGQMAANRYFLANRSYQLAKAYLELARLGGGRACARREECLEKAAGELEQDAAARAAGSFRDDYIYLRASVYMEWGQTSSARRDLELLKESPGYAALASRRLGEIFLAEAERQLAPPVSLAGLLAARVSYRAALSAPGAAEAARLGLAGTYLSEARLSADPTLRRARLEDAAHEFALAVSATADGPQGNMLRAHAGRGEALLELSRLGDTAMLAPAISELETAAGLEAGVSGAPAQLMLARALSDAGRHGEADVAYAEAQRRFGSDPRAGLARAERAFASGRRLFVAGNSTAAREQFDIALGESSWREGQAEAHYFLSAIALQLGQDAVAEADAASAAGSGLSPYHEQACLTRIAAGGLAVLRQTALPACAGNDLLLGMFYLRHAQLAGTAAAANESRHIAQDAFARARASGGALGTSPVSDRLRVADLAAYGSAVALGCSSTAGLSIPVDLDSARLEAARAFFTLHRVAACRASN